MLDHGSLPPVFKSWLVTGATDGIGKGYAHELARKGINVLLISRSPEKLIDVAKEIEKKYGVKTKSLAYDFSDDDSIYQSIKRGVTGLDIGILVNNVGMSYGYPEYYMELKDEMTKIILPIMAEKKKGIVINIASAAAKHPFALLSLYSATKAFVSYLTVGLEQEYASRGIIFQCVLPFLVSTKMSRIRQSSFFVPDPYSYARSALTTVGVESTTFGCVSHALQAFVFDSIPTWLYRKVGKYQMMTVRKAAIRRAQKKQ
ncbi:hypothetical protein LSH36_70g05033 [Paralvinella palmiformis]|uniref:Uncharacterized protein n=1 Tax=Paralvinella palmiformis TaxID=53620 RepID=A0AAD9K339_9ANNE|nr:hypothetical protein LSH36_70g05033 [Paralvinella palmiformis]